MASNSNPYARFLGESDGVDLVRVFPAKLQTVAGRLGSGGMGRRLAPGKWTAGEILCHMADTEIAFSYRWRQVLAQDRHPIQPFDQDLWAARYESASGSHALQALLALRAWNIVFLDGLPASAWEKQATHPELGELNLRTMVEIMAGHDLNHLAQLETLASQEG